MKRSDLMIRLERLRENAFFLISSGQSLERQAAQMESELTAIMEELGRPVEQQSPAPASEPAPPPEGGRDAPTSPGLAVEFDGDPVAPSLATLVTPKQLGMIRALAREAGVDYELECVEQFNGVKVEELSKRAASAFIDYLKALNERGAEFRRAS